eukprot:m51a1_g7477 hypothetical protein (137) ;mRNA; f:204488-204995
MQQSNSDENRNGIRAAAGEARKEEAGPTLTGRDESGEPETTNPDQQLQSKLVTLNCIWTVSAVDKVVVQVRQGHVNLYQHDMGFNALTCCERAQIRLLRFASADGRALAEDETIGVSKFRVCYAMNSDEAAYCNIL